MEKPIQTTKEYALAKTIEDAVNNLNWSPKLFAESIGYWHRTNQQSFMRTLVEVIKTIGSSEYGIDGRNKASHELCSDIVASGVFKEHPLPFI